MKSKSELTGAYYEDEEHVFFRNYVQAAHYLSWGATLVDLFTDSDTKLVFVFSKETHNLLKDKWGIKKEQKFKENEKENN